MGVGSAVDVVVAAVSGDGVVGDGAVGVGVALAVAEPAAADSAVGVPSVSPQPVTTTRTAAIDTMPRA